MVSPSMVYLDCKGVYHQSCDNVRSKYFKFLLPYNRFILKPFYTHEHNNAVKLCVCVCVCVCVCECVCVCARACMIVQRAGPYSAWVALFTKEVMCRLKFN